MNKKQFKQNGVDVTPVTRTPVSIDDVLNSVRLIGENRDYLIKSILAIFISTFLGRKDPLWLMVVGNPSSNKTTLVELLSLLTDDIIKVDALTANPFTSGQSKKDNPQDLLPLLKDKCFIVKEYGTIFGRNDEVVKQLISDLVAIYDGQYAKHSPTRGTVNYDDIYFSHIGCVTPMALSKRRKYMNAVGARFLFLRIEALTENERDVALLTIWKGDSNTKKKDVSRLVKKYCENVKEDIVTGNIRVQFSDDVIFYLNMLAKALAKGRGLIVKENKNDYWDPDQIESSVHSNVSDLQIEEPFRALKQLKKFAKALTIVNGESVVGSQELDIVRMVVLSSMPKRRSDVIKLFEKKGKWTVKTAADELKKNARTVRRNLNDLVVLGLLIASKTYNDLATVYSLASNFNDIFNTDFNE